MSTVLKRMPIDSAFITKFDTVFTSWAALLVSGEDYNSTVMSLLKSLCDSLLADFSSLGCNVIGKWIYDEDAEEYTDSATINLLIHYKLQKYKPYLKVFTSEFADLDDEITRSHDSSASGTSRSASEMSPITEAPINSSPTDASTWNITTPTTKGGSQYNNASENTETVYDPNLVARIMAFKIQNLNLTAIANMIVKSLVEEYNTVY